MLEEVKYRHPLFIMLKYKVVELVEIHIIKQQVRILLMLIVIVITLIVLIVIIIVMLIVIIVISIINNAYITLRRRIR